MRGASQLAADTTISPAAPRLLACVDYAEQVRTAIVLTPLLLTSCYLSHERDALADAGPARRDAGDRVDAGRRRDAGGLPDAGPECTSVAVTHTRVIDTGSRLVTPRLVAMPDGGVGVVYVTDGGSPTRIEYQRLGPDLETVAGPVTITNRSFTWAQPARIGDRLAIAYGLASGGSTRSSLLQATLDGDPLGTEAGVDLMHPALLLPFDGGLFWYAFDNRSTNELVAAEVDLDGTVRHASTIVTGRYGSGHGALVTPDGASVVLSYPRETDVRGVRQSFVRSLSGGALGPERQLSDDGDSAVYPVVRDGELVLVRHGDALWLERTDLRTLERLDRTQFDALGRSARPAAVGPRLVIVDFVAGSFQVDDFGEGLVAFERELVPAPVGGRGPDSSVVELPGAAVYAFHLVDGPRTIGFLLRVACSG